MADRLTPRGLLTSRIQRTVITALLVVSSLTVTSNVHAQSRDWTSDQYRIQRGTAYTLNGGQVELEGGILELRAWVAGERFDSQG